MSEPFANPENTDDLHTLMAIAVLSGHRGIPADMTPIYEVWAQCYPKDALGSIGRGLSMIGAGQPRDGYRLIEEAARMSETRSDQARDVLTSLQRDMRTLAG